MITGSFDGRTRTKLVAAKRFCLCRYTIRKMQR